MTIFVRKHKDNIIQVFSPGETVVLDDGTKIPYGNLDSYDAEVLLQYNLYAFQTPTTPAGKFLVSTGYVATESGVDQVPVFADIPPPPFIDISSAAASGSYRASLRRKAQVRQARGDTFGAVSLILKAAGVPT